MGGLVKGLLASPNEKLFKLIAYEEKQKTCAKPDYLVFLNKPKGGSNGSVKCTDAGATCENMTFTYKSNFDNSAMTMISGCVGGVRVLAGFYDDPSFGLAADFNT